VTDKDKDLVKRHWTRLKQEWKKLGRPKLTDKTLDEAIIEIEGWALSSKQLYERGHIDLANEAGWLIGASEILDISLPELLEAAGITLPEE
jgi:hypothetical protein